MFHRVRITCRRSTQRQRTAPSREVGAGFDQRRQLGFLLGGQPPRRLRWLAIDHSLRPRGIEALHPSAPPPPPPRCLPSSPPAPPAVIKPAPPGAPPPPVHCADLGRRAILPLISRRNRKQSPSLVGILRLPGCRTSPFRVPIRAQFHHRRHRSLPPKPGSQESQITAPENPPPSIIPSGA